MLVVAVFLFVLAVAALATGVAGLTGRLPRNRWVGVRTEQTVDDDRAFALANRIAAPTTIAAGVLLAIGGTVALLFDGLFGMLAIVATIIAAVATAGAGASLGARAAATATVGTGSCGHACGSCTLAGGCERA
ncbi:MAG TPA: SdpI family protein [Aldersonia sp.]